MIGAEARPEWLDGQVDVDEEGFVCTGPSVREEATTYGTSLTGVFAVGDVRAGSVKRVASAVGKGWVVVSAVHRYLAARGTGVSV
jgi:thioredoxin reductase (NADPH)